MLWQEKDEYILWNIKKVPNCAMADNNLHYFMPSDYGRFQSDSELEKASYDFAVQRNGQIDRGKLNTNIKNISHLVMCRDMLRLYGRDGVNGITDERLGSVALLHDTLEDAPEYKKQPADKAEALFRYELGNHFECNKKIAHPDDQVNFIVPRCVGLCNADEKKESKRIWQVQHMRELKEMGEVGRDVALLKMIDQTASLLDAIMLDNDPKKIIPRSTVRWRFKARDVVHAIAQEYPELAFWQHLYDQLFEYNMPFIDAYNQKTGGHQETHKRLRAEFRLENMVDKAIELTQDGHTPLPDRKSTRVIDKSGRKRKGVTAVRLTDDGLVAGFVMRMDVTGTDEVRANALCKNLVNELEASYDMENKLLVKVHRSGSFVYTGLMPEDSPQREFIIEPPMQWTLFLERAARAERKPLPEAPPPKIWERLGLWTGKVSERAQPVRALELEAIPGPLANAVKEALAEGPASGSPRTVV